MNRNFALSLVAIALLGFAIFGLHLAGLLSLASLLLCFALFCPAFVFLDVREQREGRAESDERALAIGRAAIRTSWILSLLLVSLLYILHKLSVVIFDAQEILIAILLFMAISTIVLRLVFDKTAIVRE